MQTVEQLDRAADLVDTEPESELTRVFSDSQALHIIGHLKAWNEEHLVVVDNNGWELSIPNDFITDQYRPAMAEAFIDHRGRRAALFYNQDTSNPIWSFSLIKEEEYEAQGFHRANGLGWANHHLCEQGKPEISIEQWLDMTDLERRDLLRLQTDPSDSSDDE